VKRLLLLAALAACHKGAPSEEGEGETPAIDVTCTPATAADAPNQVTLRGILAPPPDKDAVVAPAVAGRIAEVKVREGDVVAKGDPLATVDDPALAASLAEAQGAVQTAQAAAVAAKANFDRQQRLETEGIAAHKDVEEAKAREAAADADAAAAQAKLGAADAQLDRARVRAPLAGTVVRVFRHAGELVDGTPSTSIVEVADPSTLELRADAPAVDVVKLLAGDTATVTLDALPDAPIEARIAAISPAVDAASGLGAVRVVLDKADPHLKIGLAGRAVITVANHPVITVPAAAVRRNPEGKSEVVVCAGDKAEVRVVDARPSGTARYEISGVKDGELVAVTHVLHLEDKSPIHVASEKPDQ
jgi:RND family efflux transporter MFP subunit